jgi:Fe-S oxidoreductase
VTKGRTGRRNFKACARRTGCPLTPLQAEQIVSANVGCIQHLQSGTAQPVRHWVEVLGDALSATFRVEQVWFNGRR